MIRRKNYFSILGICIVVVGFLFVLLRIPFLSSITQQLSSGPQQFFSRILHVKDTSQIAQLKAENNLLYQRLVNEKKLEADNAALRDQFANTPVSAQTLLPAHIVSAPGFIPGISLPEYLVIDKGSADAVREGQIAIYKNIAVGIIMHTTKHFSKVTLTTNTVTSIPVKTMTTNARGVIKGLGDGTFLVDNVVASDHLEKNDVVVTLGNQKSDGSAYPPGLIIGKINSVQKIPSALFQRASVTSIIDITVLPMVFIMTTN